jgi:hypothetical protein
LKNAARGNWKIEDAAKRILDQAISSPDEFSVEYEGLAFVKQALDRAKQTVILMLAETTRRYGHEISEAQEVISLLADAIIDVYAIECAWLRTEKIVARQGEKDCEQAIDIARVYTSNAAERIAFNARNLLTTLGNDSVSDLHWRAIDQLTPRRPIDAITARRRIADSIITAGRYLW